MKFEAPQEDFNLEVRSAPGGQKVCEFDGDLLKSNCCFRWRLRVGCEGLCIAGIIFSTAIVAVPNMPQFKVFIEIIA